MIQLSPAPNDILLAAQINLFVDLAIYGVTVSAKDDFCRKQQVSIFLAEVERSLDF